MAVLLLHNTTHHYQAFVPNFRILTQVVAEKSLTEKKFTNRQTNIITEKAKTIYPLYTSYRRYNKRKKSKWGARRQSSGNYNKRLKGEQEDRAAAGVIRERRLKGNKKIKQQQG